MLCSTFARGSRALTVLLLVAALFFAFYAAGLSDPALQLVSAGYAVALGLCAWGQVQIRQAQQTEPTTA
jgi:hypothetical protein